MEMIQEGVEKTANAHIGHLLSTAEGEIQSSPNQIFSKLLIHI